MLMWRYIIQYISRIAITSFIYFQQVYVFLRAKMVAHVLLQESVIAQKGQQAIYVKIVSGL